MSIFSIIAEEKIDQAIKNGELNNITCKGKPLDLQKPKLPNDLHIGYKILKNAGYLPEEILIEKDIRNINNLLESTTEFDKKKLLIKKLNEKTLKLNMLMEKNKVNRKVFNNYKTSIYKKLGL